MKNAMSYVTALALVLTHVLADDSFPSSIRHNTFTNGNHEYIITGVFTNGTAGRMKKDGALDALYARVLPNCVRANLSLTNRVLRLETTAPIINLQTVINGLAHEGCDIPYWCELVEREHRSSSYNANLYSLVAVSNLIDATNAVPSGLVWHNVFHSTPVNFTIRYALNKMGTLRLNPSTGFCKCHNRFAMRIFDERNQWIWENTDDIYADCKVAICDTDNDGVDEIMISRNSHDFEKHLLTWKPKPQQGGRKERR